MDKHLERLGELAERWRNERDEAVARAEHAEEAIARVEALCDRRKAGDAAFLVVAEVRRALAGHERKGTITVERLDPADD